MIGRQHYNGIALIAVLGLATAIMGWNRSGSPVVSQTAAVTEIRHTTMPDGGPGIMDAVGQKIPLRNYRRIVAGSIVARSILGELCDKERIVGVIAAGLEDAPDRHRFSQIPQLIGMNETEKLIGLHADLVILSSLSSIAHLERLREAGTLVFVLGDMRGVQTFLRDVRQIAALIGQSPQGDRLATGYKRRIEAVAAGLPMDQRKTGMYLSAYGTQMFGGSVGTSYHDVLRYGGLIDVAAQRFSGWPQYTAEHIVSLNPEVIVAPAGVGRGICDNPSLNSLQACQKGRGGFVELPASWLEDPSFIMLDVAESIHAAVYGEK